MAASKDMFLHFTDDENSERIFGEASLFLDVPKEQRYATPQKLLDEWTKPHPVPRLPQTHAPTPQVVDTNYYYTGNGEYEPDPIPAQRFSFQSKEHDESVLRDFMLIQQRSMESETKEKLHEAHGEEQEVEEEEEENEPPLAEQGKKEEEKKSPWEGKQDSLIWEQLDTLFKNNHDPLIPLARPSVLDDDMQYGPRNPLSLPTLTPALTHSITVAPDRDFERTLIFEDGDEKESSSSSLLLSEEKTEKDDETPRPPSPSLISECENKGTATDLEQITILENPSTSEEEEEDEGAFEDLSVGNSPTPTLVLSSKTFEQYSVAVSTPLTAKIVIEYVKTSRLSQLVWNWRYEEWPICAWLEFEFTGGREVVFETRLGDASVYIGLPRFQTEDCQVLDLCKEGLMENRQCVELYNACVDFRQEYDGLHYDVICEYLNKIPRCGKRIAEWWKKHVRTSSQKYLTSHQLVFLVLAKVFPAFGNNLSAFYSILDFFEYVINLKTSMSSSSVQDNVDPYDDGEASSSYSIENPYKESV